VLVTPSALGKRSRSVRIVIGRATKRIARGGSTIVVVKFTRTARRLLARRASVKLWVETTVKDAAGNRSAPVRTAVTLRAKPAAARRR